jgi:D-alanine transaminase
MEPLANLNGQIMPLAEVKVSALDRGFLFGDAVYEGIHLVGGTIRFADDHFKRLGRSLAELKIEGVDLARLRRRLDETIAAGRFRDALIYIQITRGVGPRRSHAPQPNLVPTEFFFIEPMTDPYAESRATGVALITFPDLRWGRCDIKTVNLLGNILAAAAARDQGAAEAVLIRPDGTVTECSRSSFFGVVGGVIRTHPQDAAILPGITRGHILELIRELHLALEERALHKDELATASELFITGTTAEVLSVVKLDGRPVGDSQPGPVARRLQAEFLRRWAETR